MRREGEGADGGQPPEGSTNSGRRRRTAYTAAALKIESNISDEHEILGRTSEFKHRSQPVEAKPKCAPLYPSHNSKDDQDDQYQPKASAGVVAPSSAIRPRWQSSQEQQYEDYEQDCPHVFPPVFCANRSGSSDSSLFPAVPVWSNARNTLKRLGQRHCRRPQCIAPCGENCKPLGDLL